MKMYDKNGKLSPVGQAIFNSGMERLRTGEDALSIAKDLASQVKLVKYEGPFLNEWGTPTLAFKSLRSKGFSYFFHTLSLEKKHAIAARLLAAVAQDKGLVIS